MAGNRGVTAPVVLLTGVPRSGTTLGCHLLNKLPDTVALHEPMDVARFASVRATGGDAAIVEAVQSFATAQRASLLTAGTALSKLVGAAQPDNPVEAAPGSDGLRGATGRLGQIRFPQLRSAHFTLVIKHNAAFAALLPVLSGHFGMFAMVRNPLSVLGSWNSTRFPVRDGHAPAAERLDRPLELLLAGAADRIDRQIALLGWYFGRFLRHLPRERVLRYEELIATGGAALGAFVPAAAALNERLGDRNRNELYDAEFMREAARRLLKSNGPYWELYRPLDVEAALN